MPKLHLDKQESDFLNETIAHWQNEGLVNNQQADDLRRSYEVKGFDWMRLAKYSFWVALACGVVAVGSLIVNDAVIQWLQGLYNTPDIVIGLIAGITAAVFFYFGVKRKQTHPERIFSNEAMLFAGVLFTACSIGYIGKTFDNGSGHFSLLFLLSVIIYGVLAWRMQSGLIWLFALISLGSWFGTETGYQTHWANYFLGMNYPLRFVAFGGLLVLACYGLRHTKWFARFWDMTYVIGMLYFFISLWMLSIFGNYGDMNSWWTVKQISLFYWGIIAGAIAVAFMIYGLRNNDGIAREFGITFLLIFIYTKYFEYLWEHLDRTLFFSVLGISFWLIGRKAEKIWNINSKRVAH